MAWMKAPALAVVVVVVAAIVARGPRRRQEEEEEERQQWAAKARLLDSANLCRVRALMAALYNSTEGESVGRADRARLPQSWRGDGKPPTSCWLYAGLNRACAGPPPALAVAVLVTVVRTLLRTAPLALLVRVGLANHKNALQKREVANLHGRAPPSLTRSGVRRAPVELGHGSTPGFFSGMYAFWATFWNCHFF